MTPDLRPTPAAPCGPPQVVVHRYREPVQRWTIDDTRTVNLVGDPERLPDVLIGSIWSRFDGATVIKDQDDVCVVIPTSDIIRTTKL